MGTLGEPPASLGLLSSPVTEASSCLFCDEMRGQCGDPTWGLAHREPPTDVTVLVPDTEKAHMSGGKVRKRDGPCGEDS